MRLNIHIDESGTDDMREGSHIVALVFHEHANGLDAHIARYESELARSGLPDIPFHGVKLLHGHADYEGVEPGVRKKLLLRFAALVQSLPIKYALFTHSSSEIDGKTKLETALRRDMSSFAFENLAYFQCFDEIHVYYDGGQKAVSHAVTDALNFALARNVAEFKKPIYGERRLCQVADYICCIERAMAAYDEGRESTTYRHFYGTRRDLKRNLFKPLARKRY